eukprot:TRINITY_DN380_c0_g2_i2.p1 TRINITY_DN380_c0_g2~~TRINITY_DN380_c0_g2_i2.p1  ORF type:complete len:109 (+),score=16.26 TRINITY_DN380_c0_g2_i2:66-392(+)
MCIRDRLDTIACQEIKHQISCTYMNLRLKSWIHSAKSKTLCVLVSLHESSNDVCPRNGLYLSLIHISEPTRRTPISYAVFCLKKKKSPVKVSKPSARILFVSPDLFNV